MKPLKTRTIEIYSKATSAGTEYFDMEPDDSAYLYKWMIRYLADLTEYSTHDEEVKRDFLRRRPGVFPKGQSGPNSVGSILGGLVSAKIMNPNKNLSAPQLDAVEYLFNLISHYYSDEVDPPKSVSFQKKLFTIDKEPKKA
jgi:hypothetical protein